MAFNFAKSPTNTASHTTKPPPNLFADSPFSTGTAPTSSGFAPVRESPLGQFATDSASPEQSQAQETENDLKACQHEYVGRGS
jgi:hypothetical protein